MDFPSLIASSREYLSRFDSDGYPDSMAEFEKKAEGFFLSLESVDLSRAADEAIDALERARALLPRRKQKLAALEDKRVLALFFSPAALRRGGEAAEFARTLCRKWNGRYRRNTYLVGGYEDIMKGFDANLFGLPLRGLTDR